MKDILLYVGIGAGVLFLILLILAIAGKGEALRKWLGPIGGLILAIVAILGLLPKGGKGNDDLKKIQAENDRIKAEMEKLRQEEAALRAKYEADKKAYETQLAGLNKELAEKEAARKLAESKLSDTISKTPEQWFNGLPKAEQEKITKFIQGKIAEEL